MTSDLWYTLIYVRSSERRRLERERRGIWTDLLTRAGLTRAEELAAWSSVESWAQGQERLGHAPSLPRQVRWLAASVGRPLREDEVGPRMDSLLLAAEVRTAPGAERALRRFRDRGLRVGLVSNLLHESSGATRELLDRLPFRDCLESIQLSAELPWSKPHPGPYRRCLDELGAPPSASVHVGDQAIDPIGAQRAGMRAILYTGLHRWEFFDSPKRLHPRDAPAEEARSWAEVERRLSAGRASAVRTGSS